MTAAARHQLQWRDVQRSCVLLFSLFCSMVLSAALAWAAPELAVPLYGLVCGAILIFSLVGWLPRWGLLLTLLSPGAVASVYLMVCWREINRLPQPYKALGWVGCLGMTALTLLQLFLFVLVNAGAAR